MDIWVLVRNAEFFQWNLKGQLAILVNACLFVVDDFTALTRPRTCNNKQCSGIFLTPQFSFLNSLHIFCYFLDLIVFFWPQPQFVCCGKLSSLMTVSPTVETKTSSQLQVNGVEIIKQFCERYALWHLWLWFMYVQCPMSWKCVFFYSARATRYLSFGDDHRYCFQQVWVMSVGTKLVSIKWPVRNKSIMKKSIFFSFSKIANLLYCLKIKPVYHCLSWL